MTDHQPHTLCTEVSLALPFRHCTTLFGPADCAFLLESGMDPARLGRFSYLGGRPSALLTGHRSGPDSLPMELELLTWRRADGHVLAEPERRQFQGDPFCALRDLVADVPPGG